MKKIIIIMLAVALTTLTSRSESILNVAVSNVVTSFQTDDARYEYTGRAGELSRNTQNQGLTIFDGAIKGGRSITRPMDFLVPSPKDITTELGVMGEKLKAIVAQANYIATNNAHYAFNPVRVIVDAGVYNVTNGLDICGNVILQARVDNAFGLGMQIKNQDVASAEFPNITTAPSVKIVAVGTNSVIRFHSYSSSASAFSVTGINLDGDLEAYYYNGVSSSSYAFRRSLVSGSIVAQSGLTGTRIVFNDCIVDGSIGTNSPTESTIRSIEAYGSRFTANSSLYALEATALTDGPIYESKFKDCRIDAVNFFRPSYGDFVYIIPTMEDCYINGQGIFTNDVADYTFIPPMEGVTFYGTDTTWFPNASAGNKSAMEFHYCRGLDPAITNYATYTFSSDGSGNEL